MIEMAARGERGVLANGIPFLVRNRPGAEVTTVSVWILAGSRHEAVPGVAHLLEHVVMQAVAPGRRMRVIDEIEATGGDANAMTTRDHVVLYARVPTADARAALGVLMDAATISTFDDELVEAERRVVQEELRLAAADPTDVVHDVFFAAAFGDHPMGRPVGGTPAGVLRLGVDDLTAWTRRHVRARLVGVAVSGAMTVDEVAGAMESGALGAMLGDHEVGDDDAEWRTGTAPAMVSRRRDMPLVSDTAAVVLGGPAFALTDTRLAAAEIVMELLAGGNASVLNEEIRSRRGLSYDVSGGASGYRDTGVWRIAMSTAPQQRDEVVALSTDLLYAAVRRGWTEGEVAVASRRVAGLLRLEAESSLDDTLLLGRYRFVGGWADWSLPTHLDLLASVDADEVNRCARLMVERLVVATAGGAGD